MARSDQPTRVLVLGAACFVWGCTPVAPQPKPIGAGNHPDFPITEGTGHALGRMTPEGELTCESCHRVAAANFSAVRCDGCHKHPDALTGRLHLGVTDFLAKTSVGTETDPMLQAELRGPGCFSCHPTGERVPFPHTGITNQCAECHATNNAFAAFPAMGHIPIGSADCGGCHVTAAWLPASAAPLAFDPNRSV